MSRDNILRLGSIDRDQLNGVAKPSRSNIGASFHVIITPDAVQAILGGDGANSATTMSINSRSSSFLRLYARRRQQQASMSLATTTIVGGLGDDTLASKAQTNAKWR